MRESSVASVLIQKPLNGRCVDFTFPTQSFPIHPGTKQREQPRSKLADYPSAPFSYLQSDMIKAKHDRKKL